MSAKVRSGLAPRRRGPFARGNGSRSREGIREGQGPGTIDAAQVGAMKAQELGASEIAKALKIGRASVYRVLEAG